MDNVTVNVIDLPQVVTVNITEGGVGNVFSVNGMIGAVVIGIDDIAGLSSDISIASSQNISQSVLISTAQSTADAGGGGGGTVDSIARSMATSVAVVEASDFSIASSQNLSQSALISGVTVGASTADSKAVSAALAESIDISTANSQNTSQSILISTATTNASIADSKAVSDSVVISALQTSVDSKDISQSVLISTATTNASIADSKAVSDSVVISTLQSTTDSTNTSQSTLISTADSKGVSAAVTESSDFSIAGSQNTSQSILISAAQSTANAGAPDSVARSMATSVALTESSDFSTASSQNTSQSVLISTAQSANGSTATLESSDISTASSQNVSQSVLISVAQSTADAGGGGSQWVTVGSDIKYDVGNIAVGSIPPNSAKVLIANTSYQTLIDFKADGHPSDYLGSIFFDGNGFQVRYAGSYFTADGGSALNPQGLVIGGTNVMGFATFYYTSIDAAFSRVSANVVALGNGAAGDASGTLNLGGMNLDGDAVITNTIKAAGLTSALGVNMVQQDSDGFLTVQPLVSDPRWKNILTNLPIYGLKEVLQLVKSGGLITFRFKEKVAADHTKVFNGFNAKTVQEVMPLAVQIADDEDKTLVLNDASIKSLLNTSFAAIAELSEENKKIKKSLRRMNWVFGVIAVGVILTVIFK